MVFALLGLVNTQWVSAQNVTISPSTGNLIAALTGNYGSGTTEIGFENGWSAMWRHEQLPLTLTVADQGTLTPGGELDFPAGNISVYNGNLVIMGGQSADLYLEVSLPKGYRFTGYKLVMLNNLNGQTVNNMEIGNNVTKTMYETNADFNTSSKLSSSPSMGGSNSTTEYTIERTSNTDDDMGHQLYFRMTHGTDNFYGVTIKSFEIYFSAEGGFTETVAPVTPIAINDGAVSYVEIPYPTSKLDIGEIKPNTKNGATYYSYDYRNVKDLTANLYLFQDDAVGTDGNAKEDVATTKRIHTISNNGNLYYGLKNGVYYIETPTTATDQNGSQLLVGYRITDATINYFWGNKAGATTVRQETTETKTETRDTYKVSRNNNYYLDSFGGLTTDRSSQAEWFIDDDGYLRLVSNPNAYITYYSSGNIYLVTTTTKRSNAVKVRYQSNNLQAYIDNSWRTLRYYEYTDGYGWYATTYRYFIFTTSNTSDWNGVYRVSYTTDSKSIDVEYPTTVQVSVPAFEPKPYTIKFYNMNGEYIENADIEVNAELGSGSVKLSTLLEEGQKFNNDAVMFEIADCADQALVTVDVTMEALDPYIQSIDIVCHDYEYQDHMTQTFTANDFAVRGGKFTFYVPSDFSSDANGQRECQFTFEDLYSKYGDNTYYTGTSKQTNGNSRYVFVQSPYDQQFTSLYAESYNPDATYNNPSKVQAIVSGTKKFRFNNADELGNNSTSTDTKHLEEYAFNKTEYGTENFTKFYLTASTNEETNHGIRYLFTADETRYNISPATATEHRMYAYYVMDIQLVVKEYSPTYKWKEIYSETCYNEKGKVVTKPYYGLKLGTTESNEGHMGYLTLDQVNQVLAGTKNETVDYTKNRPADLKGTDQVLYIDGSDLLSIVYRKTTEEEGVDELDQMINSLADNALVYLPEDLSPAKDNFATKTESGGFNACKDIVLADQRPFFAPLDIQVSAANVAEYKRTLTPAYGTDISTATVVLPFNINVTGGLHENNDGSGAFEVYQLDATNCLSTEEDLNHNVDYMKSSAHFVKVSGSATEANKPYMIKVTAASGEDKVPFIARINGATIKKTPTDLTGETGSGTISKVNYTFTSNGTFSGTTLKQKDTPNIFYFAKNALYNIQSLQANLDLYVQPFRAYYSYTSGSPAKANLLEIVFGANENPFTDATGISSAESQPDLAVTTGHGTITIASKENNTVVISALNGMQAGRVVLKAGETKTVNVPAGLYVVNGVKVIVK